MKFIEAKLYKFWNKKRRREKSKFIIFAGFGFCSLLFFSRHFNSSLKRSTWDVLIPWQTTGWCLTVTPAKQQCFFSAAVDLWLKFLRTIRQQEAIATFKAWIFVIKTLFFCLVELESFSRILSHFKSGTVESPICRTTILKACQCWDNLMWF